MSSVGHFVGLDYHKDTVQVCVMDQQARSCVNNVQALVRLLDQAGPVHKIAIEACAGAAHTATAPALADPPVRLLPRGRSKVLVTQQSFYRFMDPFR